MGVLVVVVFDDDARTHAGVEMLRAFHARGVLTLYTFATVAQKPRGVGPVPCEPNVGGNTAAPAVGAAVGALVSLLGGPLSEATRTVRFGLLGAVRDLGEAGIDAAFLEQVSRDLKAGSGAIIAEVGENRRVRLDTRVVELGGRVFRYPLVGAPTEAQLISQIAMLRSDLVRRESRNLRVADVQAAARRSHCLQLDDAVRRAEILTTTLRREAAAKAGVLRSQAALLSGGTRRTVERRAATVGREIEARTAKLDRAVQGAAEALAVAARCSCKRQLPLS